MVKIDEGSSSLKITSASMQDAGKYTCHCEFDSGNDDEITTELFIYGMQMTSLLFCFYILLALLHAEYSPLTSISL